MAIWHKQTLVFGGLWLRFRWFRVLSDDLRDIVCTQKPEVVLGAQLEEKGEELTNEERWNIVWAAPGQEDTAREGSVSRP